MLSIEYMKQIDEVLEVEGFEYKDQLYLTARTKDNIIEFLKVSGREYYLYPLYLQSVCDRIQQKIDQRFIVRCNYKDTSKWFYRYSTATGYNESRNFDSKIGCQESAIIYVMDQIKENS